MQVSNTSSCRYEFQDKLRHILRVSGVSSFVYWLQFFIADAIIFLLPCILLVILVKAFEIPSLSPAPAIGCLVVAFLLFLPSAILFAYVSSFLFNKWDTAQRIMPQVFNTVTIAVVGFSIKWPKYLIACLHALICLRFQARDSVAILDGWKSEDLAQTYRYLTRLQIWRLMLVSRQQQHLPPESRLNI